ncbi:MAG: Dps family protein [Pseudobdellovibrio sp.]
MKIDIGITEKDRKEVAHGLSQLLADTYTLYLKTHSFHWNVEGPMFQTLHIMFMGQYTEMWNALDVIAERIRSLGHYAPGTYSEISKLTSIRESKAVPKATKMIEELITGHEAVIKTTRHIFEAAEKAKDQTTMDVLTQRLDIHEKTAWMLRSLLK